jgi:fructan beta-fructosidase
MNQYTSHRTLCTVLALAGMISPLKAEKDPRFQQKHMTFETYQDVGYDQKYRPQFHFTSRKNWLNDPNGLVYYDGEWHLYFQHVAIKNGDGPKVWGHAVSNDLLHWEQLPHAILPYQSGSGKGGVIWSGSAVVDHQNHLGKQLGDTKTIVAYFTHTADPMEQCAAYSTDRGRTFTLINDGDAVVANQGVWKGERDPKVFWHEPSERWIMAVILAGPDKLIRIWNSDDMVNWTQVGEFSRDFVECFDMYELPVDGDRNNTRWVCNDAAFYYQIGQFDGTNFSSDNQMLTGDWGGRRFFKAFYASQTFNNSPDGRVYQIAWMKGGGEHDIFRKHGMPFTQQMTFPCELTLRDTAEGLRLCRWPINGIKSLYKKTHTFSALKTAAEATKALSGISADLVDLSIDFEPSGNEQITFKICGMNVIYGKSTTFPDKTGKQVPVKSIEFKDPQFSKDTVKIPAPMIDGKVNLRILLDRVSMEFFVNQGVYASASYCLPKSDKITFESTSGNVNIHKMVLNELKSIWSAQPPQE